MSRPSPNEMFRVALVLIRSGQPVFPCKSVGEKAKAPIGALVANGVLDATLDEEQVKRWFRAQRGLVLGTPTGMLWDVLDVDIKNGIDGRIHLDSLTELGLLNGCKRIVRTPSGGYHLYFKPRPGMTNKARATLGLDVRSKGGYVLAPHCYIETPKYAGFYEEMEPPSDGNDDPLWWESIVNNLEPKNEITNEPIFLLPSERRASVAALREFVSTLREGERNNGFHWAVCRCIENGIEPHELHEPATLTGLGDEEIEKTINSALKRAGLILDELDSEAEAMFPETEIEPQ